MNRALLLLATSICFLSSCKPPEAPKITATDSGKSGPGAQTIKGGDVTMSFAPDGRPLTYTRGNGTNLINSTDPGQGFYLTTGSGSGAKTIPFTSLESKDGKLILTADDKTRATLAVNTGHNYISFRLEKLENVPKDSEPVLNFRVNFNSTIAPQFVPFDYMCLTSDKFASDRSYGTATWPYLWRRGDKDPLGGFAFFVPLNADDHNDALLRIWTEEHVPHPKVEGKWTYERAKEWVKEWEKTFANTHQLMISAEKPEDLDLSLEYAKKLNVNRVYLHTDTWRGAYWVFDRDPLSVNKTVFPRGEEDLKAFIAKLRANNMDIMIHTTCYGVGPEGSKYIGKGKKTDRRLANWGKGKLESPISATDTTLFFRPNPNVVFPLNSENGPMGTPESNKHTFESYLKFNEVLIGNEIIPCKFEDTDKPVWKLTDCVRSTEAKNHEAGTEVIGLLKAYGQNYYPDSMTDLPEITAKDYAEFFNRLGVQHHEYDGAECHNDVPWGYPKWAMFVYQNTERPMTSYTSGGSPNPWDLVYRMISNGESDKPRGQILYRPSGGSAALALHRPGRLATSPIENHFTLANGAATNSSGFIIGKPEPMFGIFPDVIQSHGLAPSLADQFALWRELAPKLTPEIRKKISDSYYRDETPNTMNQPSHHPYAKIIHEARRTDGGYEIQPFTIMARGEEDAGWTTVQEFGVVLPRQYVGTGMRVRLENPFNAQAPQFIIRVLNGYTDGAPSIQPKADQVKDIGSYQFADIGSALEMTFDNRVKEKLPGETSDADGSAPSPAPSPIPTPESAEHFQQDGFPRIPFKADARNARGIALTVTGDGSGAFLVIQIGTSKDYVVPIDFTGQQDIFIPIGEAAHTLARWGMRDHSKRADYDSIQNVYIGFGRVPANTCAKVLIENLRMVGEMPSAIKNPVIHAGSGTLTIKGEVKSDQYLWYQGGDTVGVYDLNWNLQATLPVELKDYTVDKGFSEFWIDGEAQNPAPWFDVQFITKGEAMTLKN